VSYVWNPKCTANLHTVGVVTIKILNNLPLIFWCLRRGIQIKPSGGYSACCVISSSSCHISHIVRRYVFFIFAGQIIWIKRRSTGFRRRCRGDKIAVQYAFVLFDRHTAMFGTVFILHLLQKGLLVLGIIQCLILKINIHSLASFAK
jgi:hypothetical protein